MSSVVPCDAPVTPEVVVENRILCNHNCSTSLYLPYDEYYEKDKIIHEPVELNITDCAVLEKNVWIDLSAGNHVHSSKNTNRHFVTIMCGKPVVDGHYKCQTHKCMVEDCEKSKYPTIDYCWDHKCMWIDDCTNKKVNGSKFCEQHKCLDCKKSIEHTKVQYCYIHLSENKCLFENCENTFDKNISRSYCVKHTCNKCHYKRVMTDDSTLCEYCAKGESGMEDKCQEYYVNHHCHYFDCTLESSSHSKYCDTHRCKYDGCKHGKLYEDVSMGDVIFDSKYCRYHHLLGAMCIRHFGFQLDALQIFNVLSESDLNMESDNIKFMKSVIELCKKACA